MKRVLLFALALGMAAVLHAQNITVVYNANLGTSTLGAGAATEVYWHSGAGELGPWEAVIGNWGMDDGVGLMTETADDIWEITVDPGVYYADSDPPYAGPVPPPHIGMVFRNGDGTLEGKGYDDDSDGNADDIFAEYDDATSSYSSTCDCVTISVDTGADIDNTLTTVSALTIGPNPFGSQVQFNYTLESTQDVHIAVYNMLGEQVGVVSSGLQVAGNHTATWNAGSLPAGNYVYRLTVGNQVGGGSIVKL